jgi:hypothetical protein
MLDVNACGPLAHSRAAGEALASPAALVPDALPDLLPGHVPQQFLGLVGGDQEPGGELPRGAGRLTETDWPSVFDGVLTTLTSRGAVRFDHGTASSTATLTASPGSLLATAGRATGRDRQ